MTSLRSSRPPYTAVRAAWYLHLFWIALEEAVRDA